MNSNENPRPANLTLGEFARRSSNSPTGSSSGPRRPRTRRNSLADLFSWPGRITLLIAIALSPWAFASVEHWAQKWIAISLLAGLAFWWFETAMNHRKSQVFPYLFFPVTAGLMIGLLQVVPLPLWLGDWILGLQPGIYSEFTGNLNGRPSISLDRDASWDQIRLLVIAISGLLLGCRYFRSTRDMVLLLSVMAINGTAIAVFGIIHQLTSNGKMYWVRELTLGGQPFGPFVNRNNAAGYLLICMACCAGLMPILMSMKGHSRPPQIISREIPFWRQFYLHLLEFIADLNAAKIGLLVGMAAIVCGIVASLSRGGVVALLVAGTATILAYGMARKPKNSTFIFIPIVSLVMLLVGWLGFGEQLMKRFDRVNLADVSESDERVQQWIDTWPAVIDSGVLGSGLGSYKGIHRLYRSNPETSLFLYAENQYFQALVEAGWPGLILFLIAWWLAFQCASLALSRGSSPTTIGIGVMGVFLVFSQATASIFDFGFYIPANMLALSVLFGFLAYHSQSLAERLKRQSWLRFQIPNYAIQVVVLVLFSATALVAVDLHARATMDELMKPRAELMTRENLPLASVDAKLARLMPLVKRKPAPAALNHAAALWMHRSRLELYDSFLNMPEFKTSLESITNTEDQRKVRLDNLWLLTDLQPVQDNLYYFRKTNDQKALIRFQSQPEIRKNLSFAAQLLRYSRDISPLQPVVHLQLGEVMGVIGEPGDGNDDIERAIRLAPANANFCNVAGIYYLQSGQPEAAAVHLQRCLDLEPRQLNRILNLVSGRTNRSIPACDSMFIAEQVLPEDPQMLFSYATNYLADMPNEQEQVFGRAVEIIEAQQLDGRTYENDVLLGDILVELGENEQAIQQYRKALVTRPYDRKTLYKRAKLLFQRYLLNPQPQYLEEARIDTEKLRSSGRQVAEYEKLMKDIEAEKKKQKAQESGFWP